MGIADDSIERVLHLEGLTFRKIHILVVSLVGFVVLALVLIRLHIIVPIGKHHPESEAISFSSRFLVVYSILIAVGFWIIYATRNSARYYRLRAFIYGMLLGGAGGELLHLFARHVLHI